METFRCTCANVEAISFEDFCKLPGFSLEPHTVLEAFGVRLIWRPEEQVFIVLSQLDVEDALPDTTIHFKKGMMLIRYPDKKTYGAMRTGLFELLYEKA